MPTLPTQIRVSGQNVLPLVRPAVYLCPSDKDDVEIIVLQYLMCLLFSVGKEELRIVIRV